MTAIIVAAAALVVALAALLLAVLVARQSGAVASTVERHRLAHINRDGVADPAPGGHRAERRAVNVGAPRATGERRVSPGQVLPPEESHIGVVPPSAPQEPPTAAMKRLPRPGEIGQR